MSQELLLGIIGTIIALSAVATTIWQGILTRRHNRLSVKPILRIDRRTIVGEKVSILLINSGVGPAIICCVKFFVDGIVIESNSNIMGAGNLALIKTMQDARKYRIFEIFPQESFAAGEQQALFESIDEIKNEIVMKEIKQSFDRISIEIEYESIYKEKFIMNSPISQNNY
ncbi:MAG: hypothetical protein Q8N83_05585 [Ignavibacteria bacterium]|nr:hypothetical protein [Ignavibacteria bacterium]